jgi:hypothetical protein
MAASNADEAVVATFDVEDPDEEDDEKTPPLLFVPVDDDPEEVFFIVLVHLAQYHIVLGSDMSWEVGGGL